MLQQILHHVLLLVLVTKCLARCDIVSVDPGERACKHCLYHCLGRGPVKLDHNVPRMQISVCKVIQQEHL